MSKTAPHPPPDWAVVGAKVTVLGRLTDHVERIDVIAEVTKTTIKLAGGTVFNISGTRLWGQGRGQTGSGFYHGPHLEPWVPQHTWTRNKWIAVNALRGFKFDGLPYDEVMALYEKLIAGPRREAAAEAAKVAPPTTVDPGKKG